MQIKIAEMSFDAGLDLVARCYEKNAAGNGIAEMWGGLSPSIQQSLIHTGIGAGVGGGLGLASAFTQPKDRRNYLSRGLTGALAGGVMGAMYQPAKDIIGSMDFGINKEEAADALQARREEIKKVPWAGGKPIDTKKVLAGKDPVTREDVYEEAPITAPPTALSNAAETFNGDRWVEDPERQIRDLVVGQQFGPKTDPEHSIENYAATIGPHSLGAGVGLGTHNAIMRAQANASQLPHAGMKDPELLSQLLTNDTLKSSLDTAPGKSLRATVDALRNAGVNNADIVALLKQHGSSTADMVGYKPPVGSLDAMGRPLTQAGIASHVQQALTDDLTRVGQKLEDMRTHAANAGSFNATARYIKQTIIPDLERQYQDLSAKQALLDASSPRSARSGAGAAAAASHMQPNEFNSLLARTRANGWKPSWFQRGKGLVGGAAAGIVADYAGRASVNGLMTDAQRNVAARNEADINAQGFAY